MPAPAADVGGAPLRRSHLSAVKISPANRTRNDPHASEKHSNFIVLSPLPHPPQHRSIDPMLCLSIHQPYAAQIIAGLKRREYRSWRVPALVGQRLAIHATQSLPDAARALLERHGLPVVTGAVLGS